MTTQYDPGLVIVVFRGLQLQQFMESTFISAERAADAFAMSVGAQGDVARIRNRNQTGSVTATLQQGSPSNDHLSAVAREDELFGTGVGPLLVKDLRGTTLLEAATSWIRKVPTVEFGTDYSGREWVFDCSKLIFHVGGSLTL